MLSSPPKRLNQSRNSVTASLFIPVSSALCSIKGRAVRTEYPSAVRRPIPRVNSPGAVMLGEIDDALRDERCTRVRRRCQEGAVEDQPRRHCKLWSDGSPPIIKRNPGAT